jgi:quercetin dioxygenase-like cupin family protein
MRSRSAAVGTEALRSGPGEGEHVWFLGALVTIKVPGEAVAGRCTMVEFLMARHTSRPRHHHPHDETFTLIDGNLTFVSGEDRFECEAGASWVVPAGVEHTFRVESETARLVAVFAPAGMERCFREGGVPADTPTLPPAEHRPDHWTRSSRPCAHTVTTTSARRSARTTDTRSGKPAA